MEFDRDELDEKIKKAVSEIKWPEPTSCPDEETLVCYLEDRLGEGERDEIEGHLAACSSCCHQIIAMNRIIHAGEEEDVPVPEKATRKAKDLVPMSVPVSVPDILGMPSPLELRLTRKIPGAAEGAIETEPPIVSIQDGGTLRSYDEFQIHIKADQDAYAYVALHSSRGETQLLFPSLEIDIPNKINGSQSYTLPSEARWFSLDEDIGFKTVFFLVSNRPIDDIKTFIESLKEEATNKVKEMLEKKARWIKAISFWHIGDKGS